MLINNAESESSALSVLTGPFAEAGAGMIIDEDAKESSAELAFLALRSS